MKTENKILIFLLGAIMIITVVFGYFAFQKENKEIKTDAIKMKEEYASLNHQINEKNKQTYPTVELSDDNPFKYNSEEEIVNILENKNGIIYFGFSACPWCRTMLPILESVAKEMGISEINYLNVQNIRDVLELDENNKVITKTKGSDSYYKILEILGDKLDDYTLTTKDGKVIQTGEKRLFAPTVVIVKNGEIKKVHIGTLDSQKSGYEKLTEKEIKELTSTYQTLLKELNTNTCNEGC